jgi:hypothetical protein
LSRPSTPRRNVIPPERTRQSQTKSIDAITELSSNKKPRPHHAPR